MFSGPKRAWVAAAAGDGVECLGLGSVGQRGDDVCATLEGVEASVEPGGCNWPEVFDSLDKLRAEYLITEEERIGARF